MNNDGRSSLTRRDALALCAAAGAGALWSSPELRAQAAVDAVRTRPIPHSGERLPMVGLGTAVVFDIDINSSQRAGCTDVVRTLISQGGSLIDTAPSYGAAEAVIGAILAETGLRNKVFLSTKVDREDFADPAAGLRASLASLRTDKVDLLQLHNVRNSAQDLGGLRALKAQGLCRYTGITTTFSGAYDATEAVLRRQKPDVLEVDYAIDNRDAEDRLLPAAADVGAAVLVALPFGRGRLFRAALGKPLPPWAGDFDCHSWAQFFLKYVLSHPAVTAAIPGTDKANHMVDDLGAAHGRLPDKAMRARMAQYVQTFG